MTAEIFLIAALSLPSANFTRPAIVPWQMASDEESKLIDWLKKNGDYEEVFIHENPQEDKLKEHHWERLPFTYKGKGIWGKRKPSSDQKKLQAQA